MSQDFVCDHGSARSGFSVENNNKDNDDDDHRDHHHLIIRIISSFLMLDSATVQNVQNWSVHTRSRLFKVPLSLCVNCSTNQQAVCLKSVEKKSEYQQKQVSYNAPIAQRSVDRQLRPVFQSRKAAGPSFFRPAK